MGRTDFVIETSTLRPGEKFRVNEDWLTCVSRPLRKYNNEFTRQIGWAIATKETTEPVLVNWAVLVQGK